MSDEKRDENEVLVAMFGSAEEVATEIYRRFVHPAANAAGEQMDAENMETFFMAIMACTIGGLVQVGGFCKLEGPVAFRVPENFRVRTGDHKTLTGDLFGKFFVRSPGKDTLSVIACGDGEGWDHVSVSLPARLPTWTEMSRVKDLFWDPEDCVMQLHPPHSEYINYHRTACTYGGRPMAG